MATIYDVNERLPELNKIVTITYKDWDGRSRTRNAYMGMSYTSMGKDSYELQWFFSPRYDMNLPCAELSETTWSFLPEDEETEVFALSDKDGNFLTFEKFQGGEAILINPQIIN